MKKMTLDKIKVLAFPVTLAVTLFFMKSIYDRLEKLDKIDVLETKVNLIFDNIKQTSFHAIEKENQSPMDEKEVSMLPNMEFILPKNKTNINK